MKIVFIISTLFAAAIASSITLAKINSDKQNISGSIQSTFDSKHGKSVTTSNSPSTEYYESIKDTLLTKAIVLKGTANKWSTTMEGDGKTVIALLFINLSDEIQSTITNVVKLDENNNAEKALLNSYATVIEGLGIQLDTLVNKYSSGTTPSKLLSRDELLTKSITMKGDARKEVAKFETEGRTVIAILFENIEKQVDHAMLSISTLDDSRDSDRALLASYSTVMEGLEAELKALKDKYSGGGPTPNGDKNTLIRRAVELKQTAKTWEDKLTAAGKPSDASLFSNLESQIDTVVASISALPDTTDAKTLTALTAYSKAIDGIKDELDVLVKKYSGIMGPINKYYWNGTEYYDSKDTLITRTITLSSTATTWITKMEGEGKTVIALLFISLQDEIKATTTIVIQLDENNSAQRALLASYSTVVDGLELQLNILVDKYSKTTQPAKLLGRDELLTKAIALKSKTKEQVEKFESEGKTVIAILFGTIQKQLDNTMKTLLTLDDSKDSDKALLASYSTVMEGLEAELNGLITKFSDSGPTPFDRKNALINRAVQLKQLAKTWSDKLNAAGKGSDAFLFDNLQTQIDQLVKTINILPNTADSDTLAKLDTYGKTMDGVQLEIETLIKKFSTKSKNSVIDDDEDAHYLALATGKDALLNRAIILKATSKVLIDKLERDGKTVVALLFLNLMDEIQSTEQELVKLDETNESDNALLKSYSTVIDGLEVQLNVLINNYGKNSKPTKLMSRDELVAKGVSLKETVLKEVTKYETQGNTVIAILFEKIAKQVDLATDTVITLNEAIETNRVMLRSYATVMEGLESEFNAAVNKFSHSGPTPSDRKSALLNRAQELKQKAKIWSDKLTSAGKVSDAFLFENLQTQIDTIVKSINNLPDASDASTLALLETYGKTVDGIEMEINVLIKKYTNAAAWYVSSFYSVDLLDKKSLVARALLLKQTANKLAKNFAHNDEQMTISLKFQLIVGECSTIVDKIKQNHDSKINIFISYKLTIDGIEADLDRLISQYVQMDQPIVTYYYSFTKFDTRETLIEEANKIEHKIKQEISRLETRANTTEQARDELEKLLKEVETDRYTIVHLPLTEAIRNQIIMYKNRMTEYQKQLDELIKKYDGKKSSVIRKTRSSKVESEKKLLLNKTNYNLNPKIETRESLVLKAILLENKIKTEYRQLETRANTTEQARDELEKLLKEVETDRYTIVHLPLTEAIRNQIIMYKNRMTEYQKQLDELIKKYDGKKSSVIRKTRSNKVESEKKLLLDKTNYDLNPKIETRESLVLKAILLENKIKAEYRQLETRANTEQAKAELENLLNKLTADRNKIYDLPDSEALRAQLEMYKTKLTEYQKQFDEFIKKYDSFAKVESKNKLLLGQNYDLNPKFDTRESLVAEASGIEHKIEQEIMRLKTRANTEQARAELDKLLKEVAVEKNKIAHLPPSEAIRFQLEEAKDKLTGYQKQFDELIKKYDSFAKVESKNKLLLDKTNYNLNPKFDTRESLVAEASEIEHKIEQEIMRLKTRANTEQARAELDKLLKEVAVEKNKIAHLPPSEALRVQLDIAKGKLTGYQKQFDELIKKYDENQSSVHWKQQSSTVESEKKLLLNKTKTLKEIGEREIAKHKNSTAEAYFVDLLGRINAATVQIDELKAYDNNTQMVLLVKYRSYIDGLEVQMATLISRFDVK